MTTHPSTGSYSPLVVTHFFQLLNPQNPDHPNPTVHARNTLEILSGLLGWSYTICWGVSFYPQVFLNFKRKSLRGVSIDFLVMNVLGFLCYTLSTAGLLFSHTIRREYSERHQDELSHQPSVRLNDLVFAVHALILSLLTWSQSWVYKRDSSQRLSFPTKLLTLLFTIVILVQTCLTFIFESGRTPGQLMFSSIPIYTLGKAINKTCTLLDLVVTLSMVKVLISIAKYFPQLVLNFQRKSTVGWSIGNILLDISGGVLSLLQMVLDAAINQDWSNLTSNPGKLGISLVSIGFDVVFMIQHYVLYPTRIARTDDPENVAYRVDAYTTEEDDMVSQTLRDMNPLQEPLLNSTSLDE